MDSIPFSNSIYIILAMGSSLESFFCDDAMLNEAHALKLIYRVRALRGLRFVYNIQGGKAGTEPSVGLRAF